MSLRKVLLTLPVIALVFVSGCRTSSRSAYHTVPTVVAAAPPCATPAAPCPSCPNHGAVPPPPPGFAR